MRGLRNRTDAKTRQGHYATVGRGPRRCGGKQESWKAKNIQEPKQHPLQWLQQGGEGWGNTMMGFEGAPSTTKNLIPRPALRPAVWFLAATRAVPASCCGLMRYLFFCSKHVESVELRILLYRFCSLWVDRVGAGNFQAAILMMVPFCGPSNRRARDREAVSWTILDPLASTVGIPGGHARDRACQDHSPSASCCEGACFWLRVLCSRAQLLSTTPARP